MQELVKFLEEGRNEWLQVGKLTVYVRRAYHNKMKTFDIANVFVNDERQRGKGIFTQFLEDLHPLLVKDGRFDAVYVESVQNPRFAIYLETNGFTRVGHSEFEYDNMPSFYKLLTTPLQEQQCQQNLNDGNQA